MNRFVLALLCLLMPAACAEPEALAAASATTAMPAVRADERIIPADPRPSDATVAADDARAVDLQAPTVVSAAPAAAAPAVEWRGVVASPSRPGVLAAWSARHVVRTLDGGGRWEAFAMRRGVRAVAIDDDGALFVATGIELRIIDVRGRAQIARSPQRAGEVHVAMRDDSYAVFGEEGLFTSHDAVQFAPIDGVYYGNFENALHFAADGALSVYAHTEAACGGGSESLWRVAVGAQDAIDVGGAGTYLWGWALAGDELAAAIDERPGTAQDPGSELYLVALRRSVVSGGEAAFVERARIEIARVESGSYVVASADGLALFVSGTKQWSLRGDRVAPLAEDVPADFTLRAATADGRALGLLGENLAWRDASGRWTQLAPPAL